MVFHEYFICILFCFPHLCCVNRIGTEIYESIAGGLGKSNIVVVDIHVIVLAVTDEVDRR